MSNSNHSVDNKNSPEQEQFEQLNLVHFWEGFLRFWWLCAALALFCACVLSVRSYTGFTPMYQSSVTFTVQTQTSSSSGIITSYSFSTNRATATQLSTTFPSIIRSNILQDVVCHDLGINYFPCTLSASVVKGTNMFTITATGYDPQVTYDVLQSVIRKYPEVAEHVIGNTNLYILTEPVVPAAPYNQFEYRTELVKGALIGFILGLVWVFVYVMMRKTVRDRSDVRTKLNTHCLGTLPAVEFKRYNKDINRSIMINNTMIGDGYLESFRALRNSIINAAEDSKVIMITSAAPGEGKTSVSSNLAISLAMMNKRVIIVDADIRNPNVNFRLWQETEKKMPETDDIELITPYAVNDKVSLDVLNFNSRKYSLWQIFDIDRMRKLIGRLREEYEYVIIDTSPLGITSEPSLVAEVSDAAILVVKQDMVRTTRIISVLDILQSANVKILGCVLNGVSTHGGSYGYSYRYGYGYGYGSGYASGYSSGNGYGDGKPKSRRRPKTGHGLHSSHTESKTEKENK